MTILLIILLIMLLYLVTTYNSLSKLKKLITESDIDKKSKRYKDAVKTYNLYIDKYPSKIVAKLIGFKKI